MGRKKGRSCKTLVLLSNRPILLNTIGCRPTAGWPDLIR